MKKSNRLLELLLDVSKELLVKTLAISFVAFLFGLISGSITLALKIGVVVFVSFLFIAVTNVLAVLAGMLGTIIGFCICYGLESLWQGLIDRILTYRKSRLSERQKRLRFRFESTQLAHYRFASAESESDQLRAELEAVEEHMRALDRQHRTNQRMDFP